ncbi:MAG: polymer-forming cytoskeletal protein [Ignavibacteriaceae bacterium]
MLNTSKPFEGSKSEGITIISNGVKIEGKVTSSVGIRFEGEIQGDISSEDSIVVGEKAIVKGKINAVSILVGGKISGTINAKEKLTLSAKGNIEGDIFTKILVVEEGGTFNGKSKMGE